MENLQPDYQGSISFLKQFAPGGPWVLTAINIDKKGITTSTFYENEQEYVLDWLKLHNSTKNVYFGVNPPLFSLSKKASREDIKEVAWFHIDIDPRPGEDIVLEQSRALSMLTDKLPSGIPEPTCIIFSGGGFQACWKLNTPIPINGDLLLAEDAKRYNQQLEVIFNADHCHNIDRMLRLPGTINIPDIRKRKKGRVNSLAKVIYFDNNKVYSINRFNKSYSVQIPNSSIFSDSNININTDVSEKVVDLSDLDEWSVPERIKIIIAQGRHPDEIKTKDDTRSAWLFDCVCGLLRANVPDSVIFSIITDPEYSISQSVLCNGINSQKYALRQIERGKEHLIDPWFSVLNEKHAVIRNVSGKCRIIEEVWSSGLKRTKLTLQSFEDFRNAYRHIDIEVGTSPDGSKRIKKLGSFWIDHPMRRQYDTIVFAPGKEIKGSYNLWKGFYCQAVPGDCSLYLNHLKHNICCNNLEHYNYLISWMARAVQFPDCPGEVAVVLRGGRGTGKSYFANHFGKLFGRHFLQVSNSSHIIGNFNAHLKDIVVLFADEAFFAGDKAHASVLKTLITEETVTIEKKNIDVEPEANYIHLIMASNEDHVIPAGSDERRFFMLDVGKENQQNTKYFENITNQLENGGYEALLHYLINYDLSSFNVRKVPKTEALNDQKVLSLNSISEFWYQRLLEGTTFRCGSSWETSVLKDDILDAYIDHTKRFNITRRGNATALGKELKRIHPTLLTTRKTTQWYEQSIDGFVKKIEGLRHFWIFPELDIARKQWDSVFGKTAWNSILEDKVEI